MNAPHRATGTTLPIPPADAPAAAVTRADLRRRLEGTTVNTTTFLATDYLNHFNEAAMLVEMIPDCPDCIADLQNWKPKTYAEHFRGSGLATGAVTIEAYEHAPPRYREPFDDTIGTMHHMIEVARGRLAAAVTRGDPDLLAATAHAATRLLRQLIGQANGIIHGDDHAMEQTEVDAFLKGG